MDCPNCVTPWKCNGPHLEKLSEFHYKCQKGYFMNEDGKWVFFPFEKSFSESELLDIADTLRILNEVIIKF